jgi:polyketide synthase PksN
MTPNDTCNLSETCSYVHFQALLRRGGIIIANELTTKTDFLTLTFGLTDGWWLYDDPQWRMPGVFYV